MSEVYTQFATSLRAAQEGQLDLLADEGLLENWRGLCESQYVFPSTLYTQGTLTKPPPPFPALPLLPSSSSSPLAFNSLN
jgi:hypothetical protein